MPTTFDDMLANLKAANPNKAFRLEKFPRYTQAEVKADAVVHVVGFAAAVMAVTWLISNLSPSLNTASVLANWTYSAGLMLCYSARASEASLSLWTLEPDYKRLQSMNSSYDESDNQ